MANLISAADGNFDAIATVWDAVSAGTGAIQQVVTTKSSFSGTTYTYGTAFTGTNLDIIDGLLIHLKRNGTTGTLTIALSEDNGTTDTRNLTINLSDLPADYAWVFIKFGSTLTLDGGTDYKVGMKCSAGSSGVTIGNNGSSNWAHLLRKVSLATAAAGDVLYIAGEITGAGATTARIITMNMLASGITDFGTGTDGTIDNGIEIGSAGTLQYGNSAATNYYLKLSGSLNVWAGGTLNIGTSGAGAIPRDSTAVLEFDPTADGGMGLIAQNLSTVNIQGLSRTSGKNIYYCKLNTDEAANSTSLGVDTDTGWLDNDEIVVASTTRTTTDTEKGTLNGAANASDITVDGFGGAGGGLAVAHLGTAPIQAEIGLLTRNVRIRSATSTLMTYFYAGATATIDIDWAEFYYLGENAANKRGIEIATTTGSFSMQYSSLHDVEDWGLYFISASGNNITVSNNVLYNLNTALASINAIIFSATTGIITFNANLILTPKAANFIQIILFSDVGLTFTNNIIVSATNSTGSILSMNEAALIGTFTGNVIHSGSGVGVSFDSGAWGTLNFTAYRNGGNGMRTNNSNDWKQIILDTCVLFGNTNANIGLGSYYGHLVLKSCTLNGDASFSTTNGMTCSGNGRVDIIDSSFGVTTAHATADLSVAAANLAQITAWNSNFATSTELNNQTSMTYASYFRSHKHDASGTTFKTFYRYGTIQQETTTRHTASGYSWKMTPNNATNKLKLPGPTEYDGFKAAVNSGSLVTITVQVQYDGSYNGNMPRLVLIGGIIGGIASDVTDTAQTSNANNWDQLQVTGTPNEAGVLEFYVDCDGTAGNIYVDDITISQA